MAVVRIWTIRRDRKSLARFLAICGLALVPFLVWLTIAGSARFGVVGREWQLVAGCASVIPLSYHFTDFFVQVTMPWQRAFLFPLLIVLFLRSLLIVRRGEGAAWLVEASQNRKVWMLLVLATLPFLAFVGITTSVAKYFVVALPAAVVLVAGGLDLVLPQSRRATVLIAVLWLLLLAGPFSNLFSITRFRYDEAARFIESLERPGDIVYASWFPTLLPLGRQYHGALPLHAANPYEDESSFDEAMVMHAGQSMTKDNLEETSARLDALAKNANRVFLVTGATGLASTPIETWFSERGWILEETRRINAWSPIIHLLRNPGKEKPPR